jgi:hypothetical protein
MTTIGWILINTMIVFGIRCLITTIINHMNRKLDKDYS